MKQYSKTKARLSCHTNEETHQVRFCCPSSLSSFSKSTMCKTPFLRAKVASKLNLSVSASSISSHRLSRGCGGRGGVAARGLLGELFGSTGEGITISCFCSESCWCAPSIVADLEFILSERRSPCDVRR